MRLRTVALACLFLVAIVAVAYAAAPTASIEDVTQTSMKLTKLDCGTNWNVRIRRIRSDGTYGATQTLPPTRTLACDPAPPPPPPPPPPDPSGTEPAPIAGQGYHEVFRDDFNTLNRFVWDDHIWYDDPPCTDGVTSACPGGAWPGFQEVDSNGVLHLRTNRNFRYSGCSANCYPINTITTQSSGKTFKYGYFEARLKWSGGKGAWPGFWLYSYRHATNDAWPAVNPVCAQNGEPVSHCWAGELDAFEGQGVEPNVFYGTVHQNSCGCYGAADDQNGNNYHPTGVDLTQDFHTYGMLWTSTGVSWYLDGRLLMTSDAYYESLNQPMFLLLQEWSGGWGSNFPDNTTPDTIENQIDYVDVWQQ